MTRPASKSLDEDETASFGPSGSSEALRLVGSLKRNGGSRWGAKKRRVGKKQTSGAGRGKECLLRGVSGCAGIVSRERERESEGKITRRLT